MQMQQQQWQESQRERKEEMERRRVEEAEKERQQQIQLKELETTLAKMTSNLEDKRLEEQREARKEAKQAKERQAVQQELKEKAKAIPLPRAMKDDTADRCAGFFGDVYELTQKKRLIAEKNWATHLLPLLNDNCVAIAHSHSAADKDNYDTLKQALLKAHTCSNKQAAQQMWEMRRPRDITCRAWASKVKRAVLKAAPEGDFDALVDSIATEKFIRSLPRDTAVFVRNADWRKQQTLPPGSHPIPWRQVPTSTRSTTRLRVVDRGRHNRDTSTGNTPKGHKSRRRVEGITMDDTKDPYPWQTS